MKYLILILSVVSISSYAGDFNGTINTSFFIRLQLGTQLKALNMGISLYGTAGYNATSFEGGVNLNFSPFIQKYGIYQKNYEGTLELFALLGSGKNDNLLGANVGLTNATSFYKLTNTKNRFYGIGGIVTKNFIKGDLKKFENAQGGLVIRLSNGSSSLSITSVNDATGKPLSKSGTDKGYTGRIIIKYSTIQDLDLYSFGIGLDVFTPEADYGIVPRIGRNSEDGMRIVSATTEPYGDLFHANIFSFLSYQSDEYTVGTKLGIDSPRGGAFIQNKLHDSIGLYPRFAWPVDKKAKFFGLLEGGRNFNEKIE